MKNFFQVEEIKSKEKESDYSLIETVNIKGNNITFRQLKPKENPTYFIKTDEDDFYKHLDVFYNSFIYSFLDSYSEVISYDNVQINLNLTNKDVGDGSWIKLKIKNGFEVFYAKKVKINDNFLYKLLKSKEKISPKEEKNDELKSQIIFLETCISLGFKPYLVKVKRGSRFEYYLPYQYELCNDVQIYVNCVISNTNGVNYKTYYKNQQDKDKIFYLQSRGISKESAIFLSKITDTYFTVDLETLFSNGLPKKNFNL